MKFLGVGQVQSRQCANGACGFSMFKEFGGRPRGAFLPQDDFVIPIHLSIGRQLHILPA